MQLIRSIQISLWAGIAKVKNIKVKGMSKEGKAILKEVLRLILATSGVSEH
jgi:hypothetical protein